MADDLKKLGVPESLTDKIVNDEFSTKGYVKSCKECGIHRDAKVLRVRSLQEFTENVKALLKKPEYAKLVKNEIMNELLMKPEEVADKEKVQEYFQKVVRDTARAQEVLQCHQDGGYHSCGSQSEPA